MQWQWAPLNELTATDAHALFGLRQQVFVLEQTCLYPDIDALDLTAWHLLGWQDDQLAAYARVLAPGDKYAEPAMGRVVTAPALRRQQLGKELVGEALTRSHTQFGRADMRISAQQYLVPFYQSFGFVCVGEGYDEDGIPHIEMLKNE